MALPSYHNLKSLLCSKTSLGKLIPFMTIDNGTTRWFSSGIKVARNLQLERLPQIPMECCKKFFCTSNEQPSTYDIPAVMNFPVHVCPNFFKSIKNRFLCKLIIPPILDKEFNLQEFIRGSKQAVEVVSNHISHGHLKQLNELVTKEAIAELKERLQHFSLKQRIELAIKKKDIICCFPYEVSIIVPKEEENDNEKISLEITMCYHAIADLPELSGLLLNDMPEVRALNVANYKFICDCSTSGSEQEWIINKLNHILVPLSFQVRKK